MLDYPPLAPPFRVFVLDDHRFVVELLCHRLATDSSMHVVGMATRPESAYAYAENSRVDVALIDMDLGADNGIEVARQLLARSPRLRLIGFSAHAETHYPLTLLEIGGRGFMSKRSSTSELLDGVRRVARGDLAISPDVAMHLATAASAPGPHQRLRALTAKEIEVLRLLSRGLSVEEISSALHVSTKTIQSHRANMKRKLEARTDVELCLMALRAGVVSVHEAP